MQATSNPKLDLQVTCTLNESECRALEALNIYGTDNFLKVFYEKLGKAYLGPHEAGLRSFMKGINDTVTPALLLIDNARRVLNEPPQSSQEVV